MRRLLEETAVPLVECSDDATDSRAPNAVEAGPVDEVTHKSLANVSCIRIGCRPPQFESE